MEIECGVSGRDNACEELQLLLRAVCYMLPCGLH